HHRSGSRGGPVAPAGRGGPIRAAAPGGMGSRLAAGPSGTARPTRDAGRGLVMPEPLSGIVERVTFHNPDNGYAVLRVHGVARRGIVTVVGHLPAVHAGEF